MEKLGEIKYGKKLPGDVRKAKILIICSIVILIAVFFIANSIKTGIIAVISIWIGSLLAFVIYWKFIKKQPIPDWFKNIGDR